MSDDFFGEATEQQQESPNSGFDEFFGQENQHQQLQQQHQVIDSNNQHSTINSYLLNGAQSTQSAFPSAIQQENLYSQYDAHHQLEGNSANYSSEGQLSEQDERRLRLQKEEQERTSKLIEKQNEENQLKRDKANNSKLFLQNWKAQTEQNTKTRKETSIQEEEVLIESKSAVTYKNPFEKIADNINLKASDHPGERDVTRIKDCILNKKADLANHPN